MADYLAIQWTASGYSAALYAATSSYGTVLSFVEPPESGTTSAASYDVALDGCTPYRRGGTPELRFSRVLGSLPALPDPWMGQQCAWFHGTNLAGATCYFTGDVTNYCDRYDHDLGWTRDYRALGLRNRADWIPVTDPNTLGDTMRFNMPPNNLNTIMAREGRTVGQAVLDVLSGYQNQAWLGGITGISHGLRPGELHVRGLRRVGDRGSRHDNRHQPHDGRIDQPDQWRVGLYDSTDRCDRRRLHLAGDGHSRGQRRCYHRIHGYLRGQWLQRDPHRNHFQPALDDRE